MLTRSLLFCEQDPRAARENAEMEHGGAGGVYSQEAQRLGGTLGRSEGDKQQVPQKEPEGGLFRERPDKSEGCH